jgi:hypothetical protein
LALCVQNFDFAVVAVVAAAVVVGCVLLLFAVV